MKVSCVLKSLLLIVAVFLLFKVNGSDLVVHIVPYSQIDMSEFYKTDESSYNEETVFLILNNILDELDHSLSRRFIWPEVRFFNEWYIKLSKDRKNRVNRMITDGQFEIVNGFSSQIDESTITSKQLIKDFLTNKDFLNSHFNYNVENYFGISSIGGHSNTTATILSKLGFHSAVISNLHYLVKNQFSANQHLEFFWGESKLLTHVLEKNDEILEGYDFEAIGVRQVTNSKRRSEKLVKICREKAAFYQTNHLLVPFGGNFKFFQAQKQFNNLEKIMNYVNEKINDIDIKFSTLKEYFIDVENTLALTTTTLQTYTGDFFPNAISSEEYFVKQFLPNNFIAEDISNLRTSIKETEPFYILAKEKMKSKKHTHTIERVVGFAREEVVSNVDESNDFKMWGQYLYHSLTKAEKLSYMLSDNKFSTGSVTETSIVALEGKIEESTETVKDILLESLENLMSKRAGIERILKPELTFKSFDISIDKGIYTKQHPIVLSNQDIKLRSTVVCLDLPLLPLSNLKEIQIINKDGKDVKAQVYKSYGNTVSEVKSYICFQANIPSFGFTTYFLTAVSPRNKLFLDTPSTTSFAFTNIYRFKDGMLNGNGPKLRSQQALSALSNEHVVGLNSNEGIDFKKITTKFVTIENENIKLTLSTETGLISSILDKVTNRKTNFKQEFLMFDVGKNSPLIFNPKDKPRSVDIGQEVSISVVDGKLVQIIEVYSSTFYQKIKLNTVGKLLTTIDIKIIPKFQDSDVDFVLRFGTNMASSGQFFTVDSMGNLFERRSYENVPLASNFYPAFGGVSIRDDINKGQEVFVSFPRVFPVSSILNEEGAAYSSNIDILFQTTNVLALRAQNEGIVLPLKLTIGTPENVDYHRAQIMAGTENKLVPMFALETSQLENLLQVKQWNELFETELSFWKGTEHDVQSEVSLSVKSQYDSDIYLSMKSDTSFPLRYSFDSLFGDSFQLSSVYKVTSTKKRGRVDEDIGKELVVSFNEPEIYSVSLEYSKKGSLSEVKSTSTQNKKQDILYATDEGVEGKFDESILEEYKQAISEDKELLKVLESRMKRARHNLDELNVELSLIPRTSYTAREETLNQISLAQKSLDDLTESMVLRMQHKKETEQKLDLHSFRLQAFDVQNGGTLQLSNSQMKEWEASLHGVITGAGGMLVVILLYNLLCLKLDKLPRVPIKWVGFEEETLPVRKSN